MRGQLIRSQQENLRLQERLQSLAMLEERERIAREMHDSVGQVLGYVNTKAQAVKVLLESGKVAEAQRQLAQLEQAAREVYADLREAIVSLRTATSPDRRLIPALREYIGRFAELSGVQTELVTEGDPSRYIFGPATELHLIRIVQEALTNVRKHAMARQAWVRFSLNEGGLVVIVADDGVGFDPARVQRLGHPELLGEDGGRVVRQHHPARAAADRRGRRRGVGEQHLRRQTRLVHPLTVEKVRRPVQQVCNRPGLSVGLVRRTHGSLWHSAPTILSTLQHQTFHCLRRNP
jgi:two-component sensor histidine kinase